MLVLIFVHQFCPLLYMCTGYAVLNVASKTETFEPLTHLIPWDEQRECGFYAVWNQMPVYCRYRHEEGHVVANCPKRKTRHTVGEKIRATFWQNRLFSLYQKVHAHYQLGTPMVYFRGHVS